MKNNILKRVNQIIEEEGGKSLKKDELLKESELDSFAYTFFYYSIIEEFKIEDKEKEFFDFIENINYEKFRLKDLVKEIQKCIK